MPVPRASFLGHVTQTIRNDDFSATQRCNGGTMLQPFETMSQPCCPKNCRCNPLQRVDCNCLEQFSQLCRVPLTSIVHVRYHLISNTRLRKNIFRKSTKELLTDSGALIKTLVLPICHWSGSILTARIRCSTPLLTSPAHRGHVSFVRMAYLQRDATIYC